MELKREKCDFDCLFNQFHSETAASVCFLVHNKTEATRRVDFSHFSASKFKTNSLISFSTSAVECPSVGSELFHAPQSPTVS